MFKKALKAVFCNMLAVIMVLSIALPASVSAVSLSKSSITLTKGYATTLKVSGTSSSVKWSSSDTSIATVSSKGKVVGKSAGTCYVYAKTSSSTLKCKVKVLYGRLSAAESSLEIEGGDSDFVTITAKGSHALKVTSSDKTVATATWAGSFSGNDIDLKINAKKSGTATIKVYFKYYTSIYKYITVTVSGGETTTTTTTVPTTGTVSASVSSLSVAASESATFNVYSTVANKLAYSFADSTIATATEGTWMGNYVSVTVKGVKAGTTTLKIYRTDNASIYTTVPITVTGSTYYVVSATAPSKSLPTDSVISYTVGSTTRYMLVPADYDIAYANSLFASNLNAYNYYTVYSSTPSKAAYNDTVKTFNATVGYNYVTRYVLVPGSYDEVKYNTAVAAYTNSYEYYTIYNSIPSKKYPTDVVMNWTIIDPTTKATITRYILLPLNYDTAKYDQIVAADKVANPSYDYYTAYTTYPTKINSTDTIIYWTNSSGALMYMLTPANCDIVKRNDAIRKSTGTANYYAIYSTVPPVKVTGDTVQKYTWYGYGTVYMLLPATPDNAKITQGLNGSIY